jgi:AcrR family transcriptional regulator
MGIKERREREKEERRRLILDCARKLFFERGYEQVTISQIAAEAELGKGTLYSYFESKESIYIAILREGIGILSSLLEQARAEEGSTPDDHLRMMGLAFLAFYNQYPEYFRLMFFMAHTDILASRPEESAACFADGLAIRQMVAEVIDRGADAGAMGRCDSLLTADVMWGALLGIVMVMEMERDFIRHTPEQMFARLAELLLVGVGPESNVVEEEV